jgi:phage tail sheath protein FI
MPSCSAGYNFWVKTNDEHGSTIWTPSTGVVIGAGFLRIPALNNNQIHYPPAGIDSVFSDVLDITPKIVSESAMEKWVTRYSVNTAKYKKGVGYYLQSSRTLSTNLLYQSIHIRRVTNYFVQQLKDNLEWVIQKPLTPELKRDVYTSLYNYFLTEYSTRGAIEQSIPFEQACVISVEQNKIDRKHLEIVISIILTECSEAVKISLNRNDNSLSAQVS